MKSILVKISAALVVTVLNFGVTMGQSENQVKVDVQNVVHRMKGGIGASWHAMIHDIPLENEKYDYPVRYINPRGSAYAGNPPLEDTAAWKQLYEHASWLGLNFLRVEMSQRMYEPERNKFDWENHEMQALYRILDWCQENGADVFLQQMWGYVDWNAHSGVHPLLSSPRSLDDFANGITMLLKYLTEIRGYTCIKYFCMVNEPPGGPWGYWWSAGSHEGPSVAEAWKKLHDAFRQEGINVALSGPDWTSLPALEPDKLHFQEYLDVLDIHSYFGIYGKGEAIVQDWVNYAAQKNKPFFITEIGNMNLGWGADSPGPKSFEAALSNAMDVAVCMNIGVDGFNRWSFTNRGDMDGQWQLVKTYDSKNKVYLKEVIPEKEAYYGFGMLTRFLGKYASVLKIKPDKDIQDVTFTAWKNKDENISVLMVNSQEKEVPVNLIFNDFTNNPGLNLYQITETLVQQTDFALHPVKQFENSEVNIIMPAKSISVITTIQLKQNDPGIVE